MLLKIKQAVCLNGKPFSKGINEVDDETMAHPFFKKMFDAGLVVEPSQAELAAYKPKDAPPQSDNSKLAAHLAKIHAPIAAKQQEGEETKSEETGKTEQAGEGQQDGQEPSDLEPQDLSHDQEPSDESEESHDKKQKHKHGKKK